MLHPSETVAQAVPESAETEPRSTTSSAATVAFDACALLPAEELATIVEGEDATATAVPAAGWVAGQCTWNSPTAFS